SMDPLVQDHIPDLDALALGLELFALDQRLLLTGEIQKLRYPLPWSIPDFHHVTSPPAQLEPQVSFRHDSSLHGMAVTRQAAVARFRRARHRDSNRRPRHRRSG